jgi:hypothetical protein
MSPRPWLVVKKLEKPFPLKLADVTGTPQANIYNVVHITREYVNLLYHPPQFAMSDSHRGTGIHPLT